MTGKLSALVLVSAGLNPGLTGGSALTANTTIKLASSPGLAGNGVLTASYFPVFPSSANLVGGGTLTSLSGQVYTSAAPNSGVGVLSAAAFQKYTASPALGSTGTLSATTTAILLLDFTDTFNRANNATVGDPWWVDGVNGDWSISSNMMVNTDPTNGDYIYYGPLAKDGQKVTATMGFNSTGVAFNFQISLRTTDDFSTGGGVIFLVASFDAVSTINAIGVYDSAGAEVVAATVSKTEPFVIGDIFEFMSLGDRIVVLKNGAPFMVGDDPTHTASAFGAGMRTIILFGGFVAGVVKINQVRIQEIDSIPVIPPIITNITTSPFLVGKTITLTGIGFIGTVTVTIGGVAATSVNVTSTASLTCVVPSVALGAKDVVVTSSVTGASGPYSITLVTFTPVTYTNQTQTNQPVPSGTSGCWVTLIGAGGGGGRGYYSAGSSRGGGSGGGGAGKVERVFCPVASLGATYSVVRPLGGAGSTGSGSGSAGAAATFSSGSVNLSAGGGGAGGNGTGSAGGSIGGASGTATASGVTATLRNGTAGGNGGAPAGNSGAAAVDNTTGGAPGGGGASGFSSIASSSTGGKGGDSATVSGGAQKASGGGTGNAGTNAAAGNAGGGGGGAARNGSSTLGVFGGDAGDFGAGGGGGFPTNTAGNYGGGGDGGDSYTLVEWV